MSEWLAARLAGLSLILFCASWLAPSVLRNRTTWNDEMAERLQRASQNYHQALHRLHDQINPIPTSDRVLAEARRDYLQQTMALDFVERRAEAAVLILRWAGIGAAIAGVVVYFVKQFSIQNNHENGAS